MCQCTAKVGAEITLEDYTAWMKRRREAAEGLLQADRDRPRDVGDRPPAPDKPVSP